MRSITGKIFTQTSKSDLGIYHSPGRIRCLQNRSQICMESHLKLPTKNGVYLKFSPPALRTLLIHPMFYKTALWLENSLRYKQSRLNFFHPPRRANIAFPTTAVRNFLSCSCSLTIIYSMSGSHYQGIRVKGIKMMGHKGVVTREPGYGD